MTAIAEARARVTELRKQLIRAELEVADLIIEDAPIKIGDVIREENYRGKTLEGKVIAVTVRYDVLRYHAVQRKKDGSWGKQEIPPWRWDKPEVIEHVKAEFRDYPTTLSLALAKSHE